MKRILGTAILTLATLAVAAMPARATTLVFNSSGSSGGESVVGKATFTTIAGGFTILLENLTSPTSFTAQELDGLLFSGASAGSTLQSVTNVSIVDCGGDNTYPCTTVAPGTYTSPYGWVSSGSTSLKAGGDALHPFAIIGTNYTLPANGNGNLANGEHNPFILGSALFTFNGTFTNITNVQFLWGTVPGITNSTTGTTTGTTTDSITTTAVPEPTTLALLGTGLLFAARGFRRKKNRATA